MTDPRDEEIDRLRARLRELESGAERARSIVDHAPVHVLLLDLEGRIQFVNYTVPDLTVEQVLGRPVFDFVPEAFHQVVRDCFTAVVETHEPSSYVTEYVDADGAAHHFEVRVGPVPGSGGEVEGFVSTSQDITRQVEAEAAQADLERRLRQSQKMEAMGLLAGGVAHDFNNLLSVVLGHADLMSHRAEEGSRLHRSASEIRFAAERGASLTRQLLTFSRKEGEHAELTDVNVIAASMHQMLHRLLGDQLELVTELTDAQPLVRVSPGQLEQILTNLVTNARDAMNEGGAVTVAIDLVATPDELLKDAEGRAQCVVIRVVDTGAGMSDEVAHQAFEPFFTTKPAGVGTGLGLATIYGIARGAGGDVRIQSVEGEGTRMEVLLPLHGYGETSTEIPVAELRALVGDETVLLAEDSPAVAEVMESIMKGAGYTVLKASNGEEALRVASEYEADIHVLVSDVMMPHLGGPELAIRLRVDRPGIPVLFASGYIDDRAHLHRDLLALGRLLPKPFTRREFLHELRRTIAGSADAEGAEES